MNIENSIKSIIKTKLQEGIVEKLVAENLEKGINEALKDLFGHYGDLTKVIKDKVKSVMVEQLSSYDYSKYITNLDLTLTEILKNTSLDNKKILENFKDLMSDIEVPKEIKVSELFNKYCDHVAKEVDTSDLEVNTDDEPCYENVIVMLEVVEAEKKSWSIYNEANIFFECEKDESLNMEINLKKYKEYPWELSLNLATNLTSLRTLGEFEIYLIRLSQKGTKIIIDTWSAEEEVEPEAEPEASFS